MEDEAAEDLISIFDSSPAGLSRNRPTFTVCWQKCHLFKKPIRLILSELAGDTAANLPGPGMSVRGALAPSDARLFCTYLGRR